MMNNHLLRWWLFLLFLPGCSQPMTLSRMHTGYSLLSGNVKKQIRKVEQSIVGIITEVEYEIQNFDYVFRDGHLLPDATSPVGYKLKIRPNHDGIIRTKDKNILSGGGIIISHPRNVDQYTILTSGHLVSPRDTLEIYYLDETGKSTGVLYRRQIVKRTKLSVRGPGNWRVAAELIIKYTADDIALISTKTSRYLGVEYANNLDYDIDLGWGDWVFLFGYPKEIKQLTGGWVSKSPYRNAFTVDAVVRFGFSGGPVFLLAPASRELILIGLIKSVPNDNWDYVAADDSLPAGYMLDSDDLNKLVIKRQVIVNYGTAYCVHPKRIKDFLRANKKLLQSRGIWLAPKFYGK